MFDKNSVVSALISQKRKIFNSSVKVGNRVFKLGGLGSSALKVKLNSPKGYPHLDLQGFLSWDKWDEFTPQEKELVKAFYHLTELDE